MRKPIAVGTRGNRHAPPTNAFAPGHSGGGGRPALPEDVREALRADTLPLYLKAKELAVKAEKNGDLRTASAIVLGLLRKTLPDATSLEIIAPKGLDLRVTRIDMRRLNSDDLVLLKAMMDRHDRVIKATNTVVDAGK